MGVGVRCCSVSRTRKLKKKMCSRSMCQPHQRYGKEAVENFYPKMPYAHLTASQDEKRKCQRFIATIAWEGKATQHYENLWLFAECRKRYFWHSVTLNFSLSNAHLPTYCVHIYPSGDNNKFLAFCYQIQMRKNGRRFPLNESFRPVALFLYFAVNLRRGTNKCDSKNSWLSRDGGGRESQHQTAPQRPVFGIQVWLTTSALDENDTKLKALDGMALIAPLTNSKRTRENELIKHILDMVYIHYTIQFIKEKDGRAKK